MQDEIIDRDRSNPPLLVNFNPPATDVKLIGENLPLLDLSPVPDTLLQAMKENAKMSFDIVVAREVITLANFISMMVLSKNEHTTLVATPLILGLNQIFSSWVTTPLSALAIRVAQVSGEGDTRMSIKIQKISIGHQQGFIFALCLASSAMPLLYYIEDILVDGFNQPQSSAKTLSTFFRALMPGVFAISIYYNDIMMLVALGKSQFFKWSNLLIAGLGLGVFFPLIYKANLGVKGFAYAQLSQYAIGILVSRLYINNTKDELVSKLTLYNRNGFTHLSELLWLAKKGLQSFVQKSAEIIAFVGLTMFANAYSEKALIQVNVIQQYYLGILLMPMLSISQATVKLCGKSYGTLKIALQSEAGSSDEVNNRLRLYTNIKVGAQASVINNFLLTFIISVTLCAGSNFFSKAFLNEEQLSDVTNLEELQVLFAIVMLSQSLDAMRNSLGAVSNALTNTTVPMVTSFTLTMGLNLLLIWTLGSHYNFGLEGMQFASVISFALSNAVLFTYICHRFSTLLVQIHGKAGNYWPAEMEVPVTLVNRAYRFFSCEKVQATIPESGASGSSYIRQVR